ncbi:hypothetical protein J6590_027628 [Homalodisca vitripennis]|nr:hypothetical protein J6590_027628 [Homalodisca vitripennis]
MPVRTQSFHLKQRDKHIISAEVWISEQVSDYISISKGCLPPQWGGCERTTLVFYLNKPALAVRLYLSWTPRFLLRGAYGWRTTSHCFGFLNSLGTKFTSLPYQNRYFQPRRKIIIAYGRLQQCLSLAR